MSPSPSFKDSTSALNDLSMGGLVSSRRFQGQDYSRLVEPCRRIEWVAGVAAKVDASPLAVKCSGANRRRTAGLAPQRFQLREMLELYASTLLAGGLRVLRHLTQAAGNKDRGVFLRPRVAAVR